MRHEELELYSGCVVHAYGYSASATVEVSIAVDCIVVFASGSPAVTTHDQEIIRFLRDKVDARRRP